MSFLASDIFSNLIFVLITFLAYVYWRFRKSHEFFDKNGIPYVKPTIVVGNLGDVYFKKKPLPWLKSDLYKELQPHKFAGYFSFHSPFIMIRDPELIKHVLIKDFNNFCDRNFNLNSDDELLTRNLFNLKGQEWRNVRAKLTSTFTSGKIKMMFPLVKTCGDKLNQVLDTMTTEESFDVKDLCSRFTIDVIGSCAFGIETNSLENPDSEFKKMGNRIFQFRFKALLLKTIPGIHRSIVKLFKLRVYDEEVEKFFMSLVKNTFVYREQNKISRQDFVDLLISLKNETSNEYKNQGQQADMHRFLSQVGSEQSKSNIELTNDLLAAQCFLFFSAGFESTSTTLGFLMLELALHQDIQNKMRDEINTVIGKNSEGLTYDKLNDLPYTDMVIAEVMRKYPAAGYVGRICNVDYQIPNTKVIIPKNTYVTIPILGLHRDPQYYEKPEEFYPEHFTKEAIAKRPRYTYLPFGDGPRACIGERFARMQTKVGIISMIKDFVFELSPKTELPVQFQQHFILVKAKGSIWLQCKKIVK